MQHTGIVTDELGDVVVRGRLTYEGSIGSDYSSTRRKYAEARRAEVQHDGDIPVPCRLLTLVRGVGGAFGSNIHGTGGARRNGTRLPHGLECDILPGPGTTTGMLEQTGRLVSVK